MTRGFLGLVADFFKDSMSLVYLECQFEL